MEKWNAYTRDGKLTDTVLYRGKPIPKGLYHVACEILIRHKDGDYLLMKRSVLKRDYGGMYEAGAGGAMQYGETEGYKWVSEEEFIAFVNSADMIDRSRARLDAYFRTLGYVK